MAFGTQHVSFPMNFDMLAVRDTEGHRLKPSRKSQPLCMTEIIMRRNRPLRSAATISFDQPGLPKSATPEEHIAWMLEHVIEPLHKCFVECGAIGRECTKDAICILKRRLCSSEWGPIQAIQALEEIGGLLWDVDRHCSFVCRLVPDNPSGRAVQDTLLNVMSQIDTIRSFEACGVSEWDDQEPEEAGPLDTVALSL
jgi:hypothetical protein